MPDPSRTAQDRAQALADAVTAHPAQTAALSAIDPVLVLHAPALVAAGMTADWLTEHRRCVQPAAAAALAALLADGRPPGTPRDLTLIETALADAAGLFGEGDGWGAFDTARWEALVARYGRGTAAWHAACGLDDDARWADPYGPAPAPTDRTDAEARWLAERRLTIQAARMSPQHALLLRRNGTLLTDDALDLLAETAATARRAGIGRDELIGWAVDPAHDARQVRDRVAAMAALAPARPGPPF